MADFTGIYPGRTFSGSKNPSQWFGNVTPAEPRWKPRAASEGGGMPRAGYIPDDMWAAVKAQAPGDLAAVEDAPPMRPSMAGLMGRASQGWTPPNELSANIAKGNEVIDARRAKMRDDYYHKPRVVPGGPDFGPDYGLGQPRGLGGPFDDFFAAMIGAAANKGKQLRVDWSGFGRTKAEDPVLNKVYDLESGETPPGMRRDAQGRAVGYLPHEIDYIAGSAPAQARWSRYHRGI